MLFPRYNEKSPNRFGFFPSFSLLLLLLVRLIYGKTALNLLNGKWSETSGTKNQNWLKRWPLNEIENGETEKKQKHTQPLRKPIKEIETISTWIHRTSDKTVKSKIMLRKNTISVGFIYISPKIQLQFRKLFIVSWRFFPFSDVTPALENSHTKKINSLWASFCLIAVWIV